MNIKKLRKQINTEPSAWEPDRDEVWFIKDTQRNIINELIDYVEALEDTLKEIESLTRNPREYEPSYYTINHIARTGLDGDL